MKKADETQKADVVKTVTVFKDQQAVGLLCQDRKTKTWYADEDIQNIADERISDRRMLKDLKQIVCAELYYAEIEGEYIFTFGCDHARPNAFVVITSSNFAKARENVQQIR